MSVNIITLPVSRAVTDVTKALLLAGCTSTGAIGDIYILSTDCHSASQASEPVSSLFGAAAKGGEVEVRCSYFGVCERDGV